MLLSPDGEFFLTLEEGYREKPYNDAAGHATIGYGTLLHKGPVTQDDIDKWRGLMSPVVALNMLRSKTNVISNSLSNMVRAALVQNEFDALVSLAYNIGEEGVRQSSALKSINELNMGVVPMQIRLYNKITVKVAGVPTKVPHPGLTARRLREAWLWLGWPVIRDFRILSRNSEGADVRRLQARLSAQGYHTETPDGKFGPVTEEAVRKFQLSHGLDIDGVFGPYTDKALRALENN